MKALTTPTPINDKDAAMNELDRYPEDELNVQTTDKWGYTDIQFEDNGTMPENVETLRQAVIGHRIVSAVKGQIEEVPSKWGGKYTDTLSGLILTLDNGYKVMLADDGDCCAYTTLESFLLDPSGVDHVIMGVGTTEHYTVWHIYADYGDVLKLEVGWSPGNPFYYGYGFDIRVIPVET